MKIVFYKELRVKAVLFDLDGVVVLNNHLHREAWENYLKDHGIQVSCEDFRDHISGRNNHQILKHFFSKYDQNMVDDKESMYRNIARDRINLVDGWFDFSDLVREAKLHTGLVTSAPRVNVDFVLDLFNLSDKFDVVVCDNDVSYGKPNPECYKTACLKLSVSASDAVVIEDSVPGVSAAKNAGCYCIGITTTHTKKELSFADQVVNSYSEINQIPIYDSFQA